VLPLGDALFFDTRVDKTLVLALSKQSTEHYNLRAMIFRATDLTPALKEYAELGEGQVAAHRLPQISHAGRRHPLLW